MHISDNEEGNSTKAHILVNEEWGAISGRMTLERVAKKPRVKEFDVYNF